MLHLPRPVSHDQSLGGKVPRGRLQSAHLCAGESQGLPEQVAAWEVGGQAVTCPRWAATGAEKPRDGARGRRLGHAGALPGQARPLPLLFHGSVPTAGAGGGTSVAPPLMRHPSSLPAAHRPPQTRARTFSPQRVSPTRSPRAGSPASGGERRGSRPEVTPISLRSSKEGPETPLR